MELIFSPGYTTLSVAGILLAVLLLVGGGYLRAFRSLGHARWVILFSLRAAAILAVGLLLFRPVIRFSEVVLDKPLLIFLLDRSESMSVDDDRFGETRFDRARAEIDRRLPVLERDFRIESFAFAERIDPVRREDLAKLQPTGKMTLISRAVRESTGRFSKESKPLVILFSDGIENAAGGTPAGIGSATADSGGGPGTSDGSAAYTLCTVGVGSNLRDNPDFRDVQVTSISAPPQASLRNRLTVTATVRAIGLDGRVVKVELFDGQNVLEEREVTLDASQTGQLISFEYVPTVLGRHVYTVRVPAVDGEAMTLNNARSVATVVVSQKIRVLCVEGSLRGEYGAITDRFLARDPDVEFCALLRTQAGKFTRRSNGSTLDTLPETAEDFAAFDVFILGDFDASYWKPGTLDRLVERLRDGAGLIMIGGTHTLGGGGYADSPLAAVSPVRFGSRAVGDVKSSFLPQLTPAGRVHPIFTNIADFFPTMTGPPARAGLPDLNGCTRVEAASPGAAVLATLPAVIATEGAGTGADNGNSAAGGDGSAAMPVLAVQPVGAGRFAVFCGDTTRNWQQAPAVLGQESPFVRFWGQLVRWTAGRDDGAIGGSISLIAEVDRPQYAAAEPITIIATLRGVTGEGIADSTVKATVYPLESLDAVRDPLQPGTPETELTLTPVAGTTGRYTTTWRSSASGWREIAVTATVKPEQSGARPGVPKTGPDSTDLNMAAVGSPDVKDAVVATDGTVRAEPLVIGIGEQYRELEMIEMNDSLLSDMAVATGGQYHHISTVDSLFDQLDRTRRQQRKQYDIPLADPSSLWWGVLISLLTVEWTLRRTFRLR